ncbi:Linear gramicidin synthase subunit D [compost metagenome]
MLEDSQLRVLVTQDDYQDRFTSVQEVLCLNADRSFILERKGRERAAEEPLRAGEAAVDGEDLAYMIYTSGSTGNPEGV